GGSDPDFSWRYRLGAVASFVGQVALQHSRVPASGPDPARSTLAMAKPAAGQPTVSTQPRSVVLSDGLEVFQYGVSRLCERRHHSGILRVAMGLGKTSGGQSGYRGKAR